MPTPAAVPYHEAGHSTLSSMEQAEWYNRWLLRRIAPHLRGEVLDAGCGTGTFTRLLRDLPHVTAVDADPTGLALTRAHAPFADVGFGNLETGEFFCGDRRFDAIFSLNVLEHLADDHAAARVLWSRLKPGGTLVLLMPAHPRLFTPMDAALGHHRRYSRASIRSLIAPFDPAHIQVQRLNWLGALGWWVAGRCLRATTVHSAHVRWFERLAPLALAAERLIEPPIGISLLLVASRRQ